MSEYSSTLPGESREFCFKYVSMYLDLWVLQAHFRWYTVTFRAQLPLTWKFSFVFKSWHTDVCSQQTNKQKAWKYIYLMRRLVRIHMLWLCGLSCSFTSSFSSQNRRTLWSFPCTRSDKSILWFLCSLQKPILYASCNTKLRHRQPLIRSLSD